VIVITELTLFIFTPELIIWNTKKGANSFQIRLRFRRRKIRKDPAGRARIEEVRVTMIITVLVSTAGNHQPGSNHLGGVIIVEHVSGQRQLGN
jgi:hypothetical protein